MGEICMVENLGKSVVWGFVRKNALLELKVSRVELQKTVSDFVLNISKISKIYSTRLL